MKKGEKTIALTPLEIETVRMLSEGKTRRQVALVNHRSPKSIDNRVAVIYRKLDINNIADLTRYAIQNGISPLYYGKDKGC